MNDFFQEPPALGNQYATDMLLQSFLRWKIPIDIYKSIESDLQQFGERVANDILFLGNEAENHAPIHIPYDAWGKRIDFIQTSDAWKNLHKISAQEGLVAIGYERKQQQYSRLYQFTKLYLFHPSSAFYVCPLAMTDGAARVLEVYGDTYLKENFLCHLTSRDAEKFWTSGQWMTERTGGSDVSGTSTKAVGEKSRYKLYGTKWFTSATTSEMALTLARIEEDSTNNKGLSLFLVKTKENETLQNIFIHRLKDKLGTKALPTAELSLQGTPAILIAEKGNGIRKIASMLNITRLYNSVTALGHMRRCIVLAIDYAKKRRAFGKLLIEHPLHSETLSRMSVIHQGVFHLVFYLIELLGKTESNTATDDEEKILRTLTPIAKLYSAKQAILISSEMLECFGGAGYIEDTRLPKFLRDAQVYSIWEGTTNILSLDLLRVFAKENTFSALQKTLINKINNTSSPNLKKYQQQLENTVLSLFEYLTTMQTKSQEYLETGARELAYSLARTFIAVLLLEYTDSQKTSQSYIVLDRWCQQQLLSLVQPTKEHQANSALLLQ